MKKILMILESRASYGYSKNLINIIKNDNQFICKTLVTGTHLSRELGSSVNDLKSDKIKIDYKIKFNSDNFTNGIGSVIINFNKILQKFNPDIVIIFGDRVELIGIAIACVYSNRIIAHVQAGDRSGHIDDITRMTLAKLCHIHFPATKKAEERLIKLGEEKFRIFKVGAPQLDDINLKKIKEKKYIFLNKKKFLLNDEYIVLLQHSVFNDQKIYSKKFEQTLKAISRLKIKTYIIYPNYDPGYKAIIKKIKKYRSNSNNNFFVFKHIKRNDFLRLVAHSSSLVGNSSAGLLETPSLKVPAVNIGDRQKLREQNENIINSNYNSKNIYLAIKKSLKMKSKLKNIKNIHGDGKSSKKIYNFLKKIKNYNKFLDKNTTY